MTAYGRRIERLHREVALYLAFMDEARETDPLWDEYRAWKSLVSRIEAYSMKR